MLTSFVKEIPHEGESGKKMFGMDIYLIGDDKYKVGLNRFMIFQHPTYSLVVCLGTNKNVQIKWSVITTKISVMLDMSQTTYILVKVPGQPTTQINYFLSF